MALLLYLVLVCGWSLWWWHDTAGRPVVRWLGLLVPALSLVPLLG